MEFICTYELSLTLSFSRNTPHPHTHTYLSISHLPSLSHSLFLSLSLHFMLHVYKDELDLLLEWISFWHKERNCERERDCVLANESVWESSFDETV